ncbi:DUF7009 family protein [Planctomicrobium sp. SH668]|uniref:DUF7009 family protein n=1 Tax=Planctomicrobium sp. SH668 TaxID=3448126 RepID=UPI003F5AEC49
MKLRTHKNSIRIRIDQRDLSTLAEERCLTERIEFGASPAEHFSYSLILDSASNGVLCARYENGELQVRISTDHLNEWLTTDRVSFAAEQQISGGVLSILIEKDFKCLDRAPGQEASDLYAFPNPSQFCRPKENPESDCEQANSGEQGDH